MKGHSGTMVKWKNGMLEEWKSKRVRIFQRLKMKD